MGVFKSYAKNLRIFVIGVGAFLMIGSALALKSQSDHGISVFGVLVAYTLPYTKPQWR